MKQVKFNFKLRSEVIPIKEIVTSDVRGKRLPVVYLANPFLGMTLAHVGHGPLDFGLFIRELVWTEVDVSLAGVDEAFAFQAVAIERWRK